MFLLRLDTFERIYYKKNLNSLNKDHPTADCVQFLCMYYNIVPFSYGFANLELVYTHIVSLLLLFHYK